MFVKTGESLKKKPDISRCVCFFVSMCVCVKRVLGRTLGCYLSECVNNRDIQETCMPFTQFIMALTQAN